MCILRSAICKVELGKGVNKFVLIPAIKHNLNMFMGSYFCAVCTECEKDVDTEKSGYFIVKKKEDFFLHKPCQMQFLK